MTKSKAERKLEKISGKAYGVNELPRLLVANYLFIKTYDI